MRIYNGKIVGTASSGTFSANLTNLNCLCHNIIIKPATETTQYSFKIINPDSAVIFDRVSETGTLSEVTTMPLYGTYTLTIYDSTVDEEFIINLVSRED
jgi:hypothetical protein